MNPWYCVGCIGYLSDYWQYSVPRETHRAVLLSQNSGCLSQAILGIFFKTLAIAQFWLCLQRQLDLQDHKITRESILSCVKLCACVQTTEVWTNQRPVRNHWQLRAHFNTRCVWQRVKGLYARKNNNSGCYFIDPIDWSYETDGSSNFLKWLMILCNTRFPSKQNFCQGSVDFVSKACCGHT